ncbi:hypothetical protein DTO169E5_2879 [Paecilomyces variotii]|nr:hypothetical protein DTO169E5_2879 [Paecilomyces variotii]KAJ9391381.1 hypothetical protein DTO063F5_991 [Paecilomyces variotii]
MFSNSGRCEGLDFPAGTHKAAACGACVAFLWLVCLDGRLTALLARDCLRLPKAAESRTPDGPLQSPLDTQRSRYGDAKTPDFDPV